MSVIARVFAVAVVLVACVGPEARPNATLRLEVGSPTPSPLTSAAAAATSRPTGSPAPATTSRPPASPGPITLKEFPVPAGSAPHDVAPAADGGVWYTAQAKGELGYLDPKTGQTRHVKLGQGSSPHGVILGPDTAPWVTDSGLNAIVRVDPRTNEVKRFPLPGAPANLNTAAFDHLGDLWFTGQNGYIGRLDRRGRVQQVAAPGGRGPYGIAVQPTSATSQKVFYASLAGDHIGQIVFGPPVEAGSDEPQSFTGRPIQPPTAGAGPRRAWSDSKGIVWVSEWNVGQLGRYDPYTQQWKEWKLPGARPQAYAVYVDDRDVVWLSDFGANAIVRFDPATEKFDVFPHAANGNVRQINGRPGEVWGALSGLDRLLLVTTR